MLSHNKKSPKILLISVILVSLNSALADDVVDMTTISVMAPRLQNSTLLEAYSLHQIEQQELQRQLPRTLPEALEQTPGVMVQKTANGHGSPFIRGFTGYRNIALIDGIRYNNSVYRDGPNEYFSLIDTYSVQDIELISGPSSAIFGGDAIGGALNIQTQRSEFETETDQAWFAHGAETLRYNNAENSFISRTEVDVGEGQSWGLMTGFTRKNFGDIEAADFGELPHTGYDEYNFDARLDWMLNENWDVTVLHQQTRQDDVWRTHSTVFAKPFEGTEVGSDQRRLKDQDRQLSYFKISGYELNQLIDHAVLTLSRQQWQEEADRIKDNGQRIIQGFDSVMTGIDLQLESYFGAWSLTYGFDYYLDKVDSQRTDLNADGSVDEVRIQGPVGDDSEYGIFGSYIQALYEVNERFSINLSSRYSYVDLEVGSYEDPHTQQAASYSDNWDNISSSIRLNYLLTADGRHTTWAGLSQAFRAPNVADVSRFGKSRSNEIEIAATHLSPEKFLTYEAGYRYHHNHFSFDGSYYYTDVKDFIASAPTGNIVDQQVEVSKENSASGYVQGVELEVHYAWNDAWSAYANYTWLETQLTRQDTIDSLTEITEPMSRSMPEMVHMGLEWNSVDHSKWMGAKLSLAAKADELSEGDKSDTQRIPPGGTPSYQRLDLYSGWEVSQHLTLIAQLNNVFDEAYRVHGSGTNEPGRGISLAMRASF